MSLIKQSWVVCAQVQWRDDADALQRWKDGRTGLPLVDANMREMAQTGAQDSRFQLSYLTQIGSKELRV